MSEDGKRVKFWKDRWCSEEPLNMFPILFALSKAKEVWVAILWEQRKGGGDWYFNFARNLNDWVLDYVERLLLQLQGQ